MKIRKIDPSTNNILIESIEGEVGTGVSDKHDVEIFSGDILKNRNNEIFIVEWCNHSKDHYVGFYLVSQKDGYRHHMNSSKMIYSEIIGNISLNSEILSEENI